LSHKDTNKSQEVIVMKKRKAGSTFGVLGVFAFVGAPYFLTGGMADMLCLAICFLTLVFIAKLVQEMPDERYRENMERARSRVVVIPTLVLFIIGWSCGYPFGTREFMVAVSALGFASTLIAYSALFYYYERN